MDNTGYPGNGAGSSGVFLNAFAANQEEDICFSVQIPHKWKLGSTIEAHVHWIPKSNSAGNVRFGIEAAIAKTGQKYHQVAPTSTHRESDGTTKKIWFGSAHGLRVGRQLVVSGAGGTGYGGNNSSNNNTFIVTAYSDVTDFWVQYTGSDTSAEAKTADTAKVVTGYTYRIEATDAQAANTQGLHMRKSLGTIEMDVHNEISTVLLVRLYRVINSAVSGGLNEEIYASDFDIHYESDTLGSAQELVK
jgi:hypothetical protein